MADQSSPFQFEDIPLDEARTMGRAPRMDPDLYHALKEKIQSLDNTATRMLLPEDINPVMMRTAFSPSTQS